MPKAAVTKEVAKLAAIISEADHDETVSGKNPNSNMGLWLLGREGREDLCFGDVLSIAAGGIGRKIDRQVMLA